MRNEYSLVYVCRGNVVRVRTNIPTYADAKYISEKLQPAIEHNLHIISELIDAPARYACRLLRPEGKLSFHKVLNKDYFYPEALKDGDFVEASLVENMANARIVDKKVQHKKDTYFFRRISGDVVQFIA